jgi:hypothetical protein
MRTAGIILFVLGLIGTIVFGIQALQQSETFSFLGIDIGVSSANWTPVIVSVIVLLAGVFMIGSARTAPDRR